MSEHRDTRRAEPLDLNMVPDWCSRPTSCTAFRLASDRKCFTVISPESRSLVSAQRYEAYVQCVGSAATCKHLRTHGLPLAWQEEAPEALRDQWLWRIMETPDAFEDLALP